ncbi:MAG: PKD domain-containing protein, partial [Acidimicrobiia bacterium]
MTAVSVSLALLGLVQPPAQAAETTATSSITLAGVSPTQTHPTFAITCDECLPDDFFDCGDGCEIAGRAEATPMTRVEWSAPISVETTFDPDELHQGATADISNVLTPGGGTIKLVYTVPWIAGVFGRGGDFPPGPGWTASTTNISGTATANVIATCAPPLAGESNAVCNAAPVSINLIDNWPSEFAPVDFTLDLIFNHSFTIGPDGVDLSRTASFEPDTNLTFNGPAPATVADHIDVPCDATTGTPVSYTLGTASYSPTSVVVGGSAGIHYFIDGPGPANAENTVSLIRGTVFDTAAAGNLSMTGSGADTINLGAVQADDVTPTVGSVVQGGTFVEGSDTTFAAVVADNCPAGLTYAWEFSDGGVAFGPVAHHTFADNSTTYSGLLRVRDQAGNLVFEDFDVDDVANADPSVTGPPDATA